MKKIFKQLLLIMLLLLLVGVAFFVGIDKKFKSPYMIAREVEVLVPRGTGLNKMAVLLEENKVISDARWFVLYARIKGISNRLKAGEYAFFGVMSIETVANRLVDGDVIVRSVTIPEGKALVEIKKILEDNQYLKGDITLALKEGEILPETYHFTRGESRNGVLQKARLAMKKELAKAFEGRDKSIPIKNEKELLILASIIEKETGLAVERGKVSSVFINRLRLGMKLQTDPTVIYAVTNGKMDLGRPLYKKDLLFDSPYNTYVYGGLPPAPICSPGRDALYAAAHPDTSKYLYFVADGVTGGHRFAKTLSEHNKNVALYRRVKK